MTRLVVSKSRNCIQMQFFFADALWVVHRMLVFFYSRLRLSLRLCLLVIFLTLPLLFPGSVPLCSLILEK